VPGSAGRRGIYMSSDDTQYSCPCHSRKRRDIHLVGKLIRMKWFWLLTGFLALIWFLIRVIPKPSRATYPCQRAAFPLASSFLAYIFGGSVVIAAFRKAGKHGKQARYVLAGCCITVGLAAAWFTIGFNSRLALAETFVPTDPCNSPIGFPKGIYPGRVVWDHNPDATNWKTEWNNRTDFFYWDDDHTDQEVVDAMMSNCLRWLAGERTDSAAWDSLFRYFNLSHGKDNIGYQSGQKIAIKPSHVEQRKLDYEVNNADLSPQLVVGLLKQLVYEANVPQECITICDSSRYITNKTFDRCYSLFPNVHYLVTNFYTDRGDDRYTDPRRPPVVPSEEPLIYYSNINDKSNPPREIPPDRLPMPFVEADYVINLGVMKGHNTAGVTLCAKNWYGSFCCPPGNGRNNDAHHMLLNDYTPESGHYRVLVDLMGHEHLGGKAMLFILDGLWGFPWHGSSSRPTKWQNTPFNNDYPSSILMSQDMVAIDSVALDFLRAEFADNMGGSRRARGAIDDYLHEAAQADNPASGTFYDPEGDGTLLESLGVHEHWNNPVDKQYSRNLYPAEGAGIELVSSEPWMPFAVDFDRNRIVDAMDFMRLAKGWLGSNVIAGSKYDIVCDMNDDGKIDFTDYAIFARFWLQSD